MMMLQLVIEAATPGILLIFIVNLFHYEIGFYDAAFLNVERSRERGEKVSVNAGEGYVGGGRRTRYRQDYGTYS
jgi:hypothetical protein